MAKHSRLLLILLVVAGCSPIVPKPDDGWLGDAYNHVIKEQKNGR